MQDNWLEQPWNGMSEVTGSLWNIIQDRASYLMLLTMKASSLLVI